MAPNNISNFFTKLEIDRYKEGQYETKNIKDDERIFDMVKVTDNQYIGAYSVKKLMRLRENSLIWYNVNTQRPMTYVVKNGEEEFYPTINRKAVAEIRSDLDNDIYIPTTITLNINDDRYMEPRYEDGKLIFDELKPFDIIDGFHRYLAMASKYDDSNGEYDFDIELRIVQFSEKKAKHFIYQEDKKTKMSKYASASLNQHDFKNLVGQRLNEDEMFKGLINVNGKIDSGVFSSLLNIFRIKSQQEVITITKKFNKFLGDLWMSKPDLFEKRWDNWQIQSVVYAVYKGISVDETIKLFEYFENVSLEFKKKVNYKWELSKKNQEILEEVRSYV